MSAELIIILVVLACAAFLHGYTGFGFGLVAMTAFSFLAVDIERISVVVTITVIILMIEIVVLAKKSAGLHWIMWKAVGLIFIGELVGIPIGYWFVLNYGGLPIFRFVFGIILIGFCINGLLRPKLKTRIPDGYVPLIGLASGLVGGAIMSGGPPLVLYLYSREDEPRRTVATLQVCFLFMCLYRLVIVGVGTLGITGDILFQSSLAIPAILLMTALGFMLSKRVSSKSFLKVVFVFIGVAGLVNIFKALQAWRI
jgi:uncharacterized protein